MFSSTRVFSYKRLAPTRYRPPRIKIIDKWFDKSVTFKTSGKSLTAAEEAMEWLTERGFQVAGYNSAEQIIILKNFNSDQQLK